MRTQILVKIPEFNWLLKEKDFDKHSELVVGEKGGIKYGKNSYFVDKEWFDQVMDRRSKEVFDELYNM